MHLLLLFPGRPEDFVADAWARLPLELPVIVLLLLVVNKRLGRGLCALLVVAMGLLLLLRLADLGSYLAFNRRFSPLLEIHLIADGWNLVSNAIGPVEAGIVMVLTLLLMAALALLLYRCLRTISQMSGKSRAASIWICAALSVIGASTLAAERQFAFDGPVEANVIPEFANRITTVRQSIIDQRQFIAELQHDEVLSNATPAFGALADRDVIIIFVESYGRGYLEAERFTDRANARLAATESTILQAGLTVKSGWLTSPIRGGRSWLAHATLQSGLKVDNQARFDRLVTTDRPSLSNLFQQAGWQSVGVMPGIQLDWPEGTWYDYEQLYTSAEMGFAGQRFGYVTMPDQYTLVHFDNTIRRSVHETLDKPVMATIALLSTHAPWTPLPKKINWDLIGDGSVYDGSHRNDEPINWKYRTRVQDMYAESFDYTLDVIGEYAARYAEDAVVIVVGDHQPPPIINGWGNSGDVPIHFITRDPALLKRLPDSDWVPGMHPGALTDSQPMSSLRKTLSTLFES